MCAAFSLCEKLGIQRQEEGPDLKTLFFFATISTESMYIWVHWVKVRPDKEPVYYINKLDSQVIGGDKAYLDCVRSDLDDILDWGCVGRLPSLKSLSYKIFEYAD